MIAVDLDDVAAIAEQSIDRFRLEGLPTYLVPEEAAEFAAWKRGSRVLSTPETNPWLANIRDTTAAGAKWSRVRIVDYPLSEYSEYELHGYQANAAAGETIYIADRAWSPTLDDLCEDFWMFDHTVIRMIYDEEGHFLRPEIAKAERQYERMRVLALRYAVPLHEFLVEHEPRLTA